MSNMIEPNLGCPNDTELSYQSCNNLITWSFKKATFPPILNGCQLSFSGCVASYFRVVVQPLWPHPSTLHQLGFDQVFKVLTLSKRYVIECWGYHLVGEAPCDRSRLSNHQGHQGNWAYHTVVTFNMP